MFGANVCRYQKFEDGKPYCYPVQAGVDAATGAIRDYRSMPFPFKCEFGMRFG